MLMKRLGTMEDKKDGKLNRRGRRKKELRLKEKNWNKEKKRDRRMRK